MLDTVLKGLSKVFGTKSDRDIKEIVPYVGQINAFCAEWQTRSDDEIRQETAALKQEIDAHLHEIDQQLATLQQRVDTEAGLDVMAKEDLFEEIDALEKERNQSLEKVLLQVLPRAFAVVKETARRFKENGELRVTATERDREIAARHGHVSLEGDTAIWSKHWLAAGQEITWDMVHYDVQLIGGVVLHQGKIAEMATGEGKTLVATLPAYLNALARRGVHIVTVNDYLAKRDSEWMAPLFEFHGLRVDCVDKHQPNSPERRQAYLADITYGTNNEFGFDYLRDNMVRVPEEMVQRKHHYAMVDEVDSVLVDEARTPLIISGPVARGDKHEFDMLRPRIARLVEEQRKLVNALLVEARRKLADGQHEEGGLALFRAYRGLPKYKPLIKFLGETGMRTVLQKTENIYLQDNSRLMPQADQPLFFTIDEKQNTVDLTEKGIDYITLENEDKGFFVLPDIGMEIARIEGDTTLADTERLERKETVIADYSEKTQRIHSANQLLKAYALFERDTEYVVMDGKVKIVDEQTGRIMEGRRYSDGLHQAIEAKENVKIEDATQTYATITLQNYFRMYHKLAGMTGTAETEAGELWQIYKLDVVVIPTNKPIVRADREDLVYKSMREKFNAVADEIVQLTQAGRPVLVGTTSVEISELLSRMLKIRKINHQVLNAKYHQREAEIVASAGMPGTVTIATNMAGRGTDIKLTPEAKAAGGLAIIGTERHESRRVDRQLRGRAGRQGDPGTSQFYVSLEDNLMRIFGSERIARLMDRMGLEEGEVIQHSMITKSIERAQRKVEENNFGVRKRLLEYDDVMNAQRSVIYRRRRNALFGERLELDLMTAIYDICDELIAYAKQTNEYDDFAINVIRIFGVSTQLTKEAFEAGREGELAQQLYQEVVRAYWQKNRAVVEKTLPVFRQVHAERGAQIENVVVPFTDGRKHMQVVANLQKVLDGEGRELVQALERSVALAMIDVSWKEHLREMDDLKQSVQNAYLEQKDPLLIYKREALELFKRFIGKLNEETVDFLFKANLPIEEPQEVREARRPAIRRPMPRGVQEQKADVAAAPPDMPRSLPAPDGARTPTAEAPPRPAPVRVQKAVASRNQRVSVRYHDGKVKKDVKFKSVEEDLRLDRCVLLD